MNFKVLPNRLAVYLTALAGLAGAVAVPLANLDTTSTVGVIAGLGTILGVVATWLRGWQAHEARGSSWPLVDLELTELHGDEPDEADEDPVGLDEDPLAVEVPVADPSTIPPDAGDKGAL